MEIILGVILLLQIVLCIAVFLLFKRQSNSDTAEWKIQYESLEKGQARLEALLREESTTNRREIKEELRVGREEATNNHQSFRENFNTNLRVMANAMVAHHTAQTNQLTKFREELNLQLKEIGVALRTENRSERELLDKSLKKNSDDLSTATLTNIEGLKSFFAEFSQTSKKDALSSREELARSFSTLAISLREENQTSFKALESGLKTRQEEHTAASKQRLEYMNLNLGELIKTEKQDAQALRTMVQAELKNTSDSLLKQSGEVAKLQIDQLNKIDLSLKGFNDSVVKSMNEISRAQQEHFTSFATQMGEVADKSDKRLEAVRGTVEGKLKELSAENSKKLEEMRLTVDEKLQGTLEKRLGESFTLVSERLEQVQRGLGEMQTLASGVGDLKRVLTNVKTRGTWGEIQLGNLLEQVLTPDQFSSNVAVKKGAERVEFAISLPGKDDSRDQLWLPIDAKFPQESYLRLLDAQDNGDVASIESAAKALDSSVRNSAQAICDKYISPPDTTDFAILYLPSEGLYAEVVRRTGTIEFIQRECRVVIAGPTTLAALLNSLQMGFRSLAIQKRSSEVWEVLGGVKTEFMKYGDVLAKVKKKLNEAEKTIGDAEIRTRSIERKLRGVEALPLTEGNIDTLPLLMREEVMPLVDADVL